MDIGTLTCVPDELRQFAALAPLATVTPVSGTVQATPPLAGPMPESATVEAHVRFCVEHTGTVTLQATNGIASLIDAALSIASRFESADQANATVHRALADELRA
ncbi:hypothetical protein JOF29_005761 [Kribbella aluminosa]|uniref:PE family protein n=1 Tax=Kribbella aluminosa TaxID=416017 RepID=A0ABS4USN0_9ACTN|nr:hypothetical protein [Kribbella aluminosa]MBP2354651.1 hypothetical protein [Kribbella aluminosa]